MKVQSRRAAIVLLLMAFFVAGLVIFIGRYLKEAPMWAGYSANKHLYINGQPKNVAISDRNGATLYKSTNGKIEYNSDQTIRTAVMHAVGDPKGNVSTGALTAFKKQLTGWNLIDGVYSTGSGRELKLTIDANLCAAAYEALAGRKGTVGVYNYKTGEILCMVSSPSFDPQNPPTVDSGSEKYNGVYINRLLSGSYTPGSVFKLVTAAAAIDNLTGVTSRTFDCTSELNLNGGKVTCPTAHGKEDLQRALAVSCNTTFGELAVEVGPSVLQSYAQKAGFNSNLYVDGIKAAQGKVDVTKADKLNLAWAGVGQYTDTANPLTYMAYVGAIANGGVRVTPRLLENSQSPGNRILSSETAKTISAMMRNDVKVNYGEENYQGLQLCAKSGTAQLSEGEKPHAWFTGFMDRQDCPLAFVVVVENGGAGSSVAGPIAGKVLQKAVQIETGK